MWMVSGQECPRPTIHPSFLLLLCWSCHCSFSCTRSLRPKIHSLHCQQDNPDHTQDVLFVHRCLVALIKRFLLSSPMHCNEISHRGSSKPLVIVSCPKLYHQHAGNAGRSVRPRCTFLNGCLTNTGTSRQPAIVSRNTWMLHFRCHAPTSLVTSPSCWSDSDAI